MRVMGISPARKVGLLDQGKSTVVKGVFPNKEVILNKSLPIPLV